MFIVVDIDHTISDAAWRNYLIEEAHEAVNSKGMDAWDIYHSKSIHDKPVTELIKMINSLHSVGWSIIGLTARNERWRQLTNSWLIKHGVMIDILLMRRDDDFRPTAIVKLDSLKEWHKTIEAQYDITVPEGGILLKDSTIIVIDDRDDIAAIFKAQGLTVLQAHIGRLPDEEEAFAKDTSK